MSNKVDKIVQKILKKLGVNSLLEWAYKSSIAGLKRMARPGITFTEEQKKDISRYYKEIEKNATYLDISKILYKSDQCNLGKALTLLSVIPFILFHCNSQAYIEVYIGNYVPSGATNVLVSYVYSFGNGNYKNRKRLCANNK